MLGIREEREWSFFDSFDTYRRYFHVLLWSFLVLSIIVKLKFVCPPAQMRTKNESFRVMFKRENVQTKTRGGKKLDGDLLNSVRVDKVATDHGDDQNDERG